MLIYVCTCADFNLAKLIPEWDKYILSLAYQCLISLLRVKALTAGLGSAFVSIATRSKI